MADGDRSAQARAPDRQREPQPGRREAGDGAAADRLPRLPSLSLPRGGGAIRSIGEKFQTNAATGTASLTIPINVSPGRSGFGPALALSYDSGSGNSAYGLGWSVAIPSIRRKTDKGLPQYRDDEDSDTFILGGAEDLVPLLLPGGWIRDVHPDGAQTITRYRPRVESAFTRIERVEGAAGVFWRTVTRDDVVTTYGTTENSRIFDPAHPERIFEWLIDRSTDDKGNAIAYEYAPENLRNVAAALHEQHRLSGVAPFTNRYPKTIRYGNREPLGPDDALPADAHWLFSVVFDYGPANDAHPDVVDYDQWPARDDAFSVCRAGFEVRTYRLCRRILMFHRFAELDDGGAAVLVKSTDLDYEAGPAQTFLRSVRHSGYVRRAGVYTGKSLPPLELEYTEATFDATVHVIDGASLEGAPAGADGTHYRFVDLDGEALSGVLTEQGGAWWYKRNEGGGAFAPPERVERLPSLAHLSGSRQQLLDLDGDGKLALVDYSGPTPGFFERTAGDDWQPFRPFRSLPRIAWDDANLRFVDLDGDGHADVLITEHDAISWYPSLANFGFDSKREVPNPVEEARGPRVVFADGTQSIVLADMSGDGLQDLVRIRNGEVCYWPNLGYGRFGAQVIMSGAPRFDVPDLFDQRRVRMADVDGTGTTDLIYLHEGSAEIWINEAGNGFAAPRAMAMPHVDNVNTVTVVDLLGSGTSSIVWSTPLPAHGAPWRYIDLLQGKKPHLLRLVRNNLGAETTIEYSPSTKFYLADRRAGRPWVTKLPFVVQTVERVVAEDLAVGHRRSTTYSYHHGYFDGVEREFRGFGRVEERIAESFPGTPGPLDQPPEVIKTWFHTGAWIEASSLEAQFRTEYWRGDPAAWTLADTVPPPALTAAEQREAVRAMRGRPLRREIFADDGSAAAERPYSVVQTTFAVRLLQPRLGQRYAAFAVEESETLTAHYERIADDPRIEHHLIIDVDEFGSVTAEASVAYARRVPRAPAADEQGQTTIRYETHAVSNHEDASWRHIGVPVERRAYELYRPAVAGRPFHAGELRASFVAAAAADAPPAPGATAKRLLSAHRIVYWNNDLTNALALGDPGRRAIVRETFDATFTAAIVGEVFGARVTDVILQDEGGYLRWPGDVDGIWWGPSGRNEVDAARFYQPIAYTDPFGHRSTAEYDAYALLVTATHDALPAAGRNTFQASNHYRTLTPWRVIDPNGNRTAVRFDALGMVVATAVIDKAGHGDVFDETTSEPAAADDPTTRLSYDLDSWRLNAKPCFVRTEAREKHGAVNPRWQISYSYSDGSGHEILKKTQAEAGLAPARDNAGNIVRDGGGNPVLQHTDSRWVGSGRVVLNNRGNAVKRYQPYFAPDERFDTEDDLVHNGVSAVLHYDPVDRVVRTDYPNGTFSRVDFSSWEQATWDENDTVLDSQWHVDRAGLPAGDPERRADALSAVHAGTSGRALFDARSRAVVTIEKSDAATEHLVRTTYDIEGHQRAIRNARGVDVVRQRFDLQGRKIATESADAGASRTLLTTLGKTVRTWDGSGASERLTRVIYDEVERPLQRWVKDGAAAEILVEVNVYGELHPDAARNLRLQLFRIYDSAGAATHERYDFKQNVRESARVFAVNFHVRATWDVLAADDTIAAMEGHAAGALSRETFTTLTEYDALNRVTQVTRADASVIVPTYNEANLLESIDVHVGGAGKPATPFVTDVDYDAKGQRTRIAYGNGVVTESTYDPLTFRLARTLTSRPASPGVNAATLQDLRYTYDAAGHIVAIGDDAQQDVFFDNAVVEPHAQYEYDSLYRLTFASGRELAAFAAGVQPDQDQIPRRPLPHNNDAAAVRRYEQRYTYDLAGNFKTMRHSSGGVDFWTRRYEIDANSNRVLSTSRPGDAANPPFTGQYAYDPFGNMTALPGVAGLTWNEHEQLASADLGGGGTAYYAYDEGGHRLRKVIEHLDGSTEETLYVDDVEVFRTHNGGGALRLERWSLHVMDHARRIALVETTTVDGGVPVALNPVLRYQFDNHLGSALLEVDERGRALSYEEFYPFGETSYRSAQGIAETSLKRYRYHGKERDAETGLYYFGARYYVPWLGRWISPDPAGADADLNLYVYVKNNPVTLSDPSGMWPSLRTIAIIAAVVVVGTVVTVATAGVAGPIVAGAVASVGLTGTAATVATGVVVGAIAGAAGGAASEAARQGVTPGASFDLRAIGHAAISGAAAGALTGGLSAIGTARAAAASARAASAGVRAAGNAGRAARLVDQAARVGRAAARGAVTGAVGGAAGEGARQLVTGERNLGLLAQRTLQGAVVGGALSAGGVVVPRNTGLERGVGALNRIETAFRGTLGRGLARLAFRRPGTAGFEAAERAVAVGRPLNVGGEQDVKPGQAIVNPGRDAMSVQQIRALNPRTPVVGESVEQLSLPSQSVPSAFGQKLPTSIDPNQFAEQLGRTVVPGGRVSISFFGPNPEFGVALQRNGFINLKNDYDFVFQATRSF